MAERSIFTFDGIPVDAGPEHASGKWRGGSIGRSETWVQLLPGPLRRTFSVLGRR